MAPKPKGRKSTRCTVEFKETGTVTTMKVISTRTDIEVRSKKDLIKLMETKKEQGENFRYIDEGVFFESNVMPPLCPSLQKSDFKIALLLLEKGANVHCPFEGTLPMGFALENDYCTVEIVKAIIDKGFPKNGVVHIPTKQTSLHRAVMMNHLHIVRFLFSLSVNPNVTDKMGKTPLHYAAQNGYTEMVIYLVKHGSHIDSECLDNNTPMFYAIQSSKCEMVELLLSLGANVHYVNSCKHNPMAPLHYSAHHCELEILQMLISHGADVNMTLQVSQELPLHAAARAKVTNQNQNDFKKVVEVLINKSTDINVKDKSGLTPLDMALQYKNLILAKILITSGSDLNNKIPVHGQTYLTTFQLAAHCCDKEIMELCFEYGANPETTSDEGLPIFGLLNSILGMFKNISHSFNGTKHQTLDTQYQLVEIFKMLWRRGLPCNKSVNATILSKYKFLNKTKIPELLKVQDSFMQGIKSCQLRKVRKAVDQGAEINCSSSQIPFPMHYLASKGEQSLIELLLSSDVNVNTVNEFGKCPLYVAAEGGYLKCCMLLLEHGACFNYSSKKCRKTPLDIAKKNNHSEVIELLTNITNTFNGLKKGETKNFTWNKSLVNCCNRSGNTLIGQALQCGMDAFAQELMMKKIVLN